MLRGGASSTETNEARERGEPDRYTAARDYEADTDRYWRAVRTGFWQSDDPMVRVELSPHDRPPDDPYAAPHRNDYADGVAGGLAYQRATHQRETEYKRVSCDHCGRPGWTYLAAGHPPPDTIRCDRCDSPQRSGHGERSR